MAARTPWHRRPSLTILDEEPKFGRSPLSKGPDDATIPPKGRIPWRFVITAGAKSRARYGHQRGRRLAVSDETSVHKAQPIDPRTTGREACPAFAHVTAHLLATSASAILSTRLPSGRRGGGRAGLGGTYEAAHARVGVETSRAFHRRLELLAAGKLQVLPGPSHLAALKSYIDTAGKLYDGLDRAIRGYKKTEEPVKKRILALWESSMGRAGSAAIMERGERAKPHQTWPLQAAALGRLAGEL